MTNPLIASLVRAVEAAPDDVPLRLHLATLEAEDGNLAQAVSQCAVALQHQPDSVEARELMARFLAPPAVTEPADSLAASAPEGAPSAPEAPAPAEQPGFDWERAEQEVNGTRFVEGEERAAHLVIDPEDSPTTEELFEIETPSVTLAQVGGLQDVKDRLEVSFLGPLRNEDLRSYYGKSLRGGLLLYGPPGCGKTFIARAIAGEMGAHFINVTLTDVLDMYIGNSEANLHQVFTSARHRRPCVVFLDELDAIGQKRSLSRNSGMRGVVNTLLQELDGVGSDNEGLYVLAATNTPWDVDPALRRPGRLDRTVLVLPPDHEARVAILKGYLEARPIEGIDLQALARSTDGFTGADLTHLCESAAERALADSVRRGRPRPIGMRDFTTVLRQIRPSAKPWFDQARNVLLYADRHGEYDDLRAWMKGKRLL